MQAYEYAHAAFTFSGHIYGATFFMATGFHGAHVLIGTIFLIVCLVRAYKGHFTPTQHLGFEFAAWYWHFVDVVWLFLFVCIYVWGGGHAAARTDADRFRCKGAAQAAPFALGDDCCMTDTPTFTDPVRAGLAVPLSALRQGQAAAAGFSTSGRAARSAGSTTASPMPATGRRSSSSCWRASSWSRPR